VICDKEIDFGNTMRSVLKKTMNNIIQEIEKLNKDSRTVKTAHFLAFQNKQKIHRVLGICIITINVIVLSPLLEILTLKNIVFVIKILSIISASLAAAQTFFNYQKEIELHLSAGEAYANIYRQSRFILAKYTDKLIGDDDFLKDSQALLKDYLNANNIYKTCVPSNKEYSEAVKSNEKRTQ
jgi:hypothetical protein